MRVVIAEPAYLPTCGLLARADRADCLILLDVVPFRDLSPQNTARMPGHVLRVPVQRDARELRDAKIDDAIDWRDDHWRWIRERYEHHPFFDLYAEELARAYTSRWSALVDLTGYLVKLLVDFFELRKSIVWASGLARRGTDVSGAKSDLRLNLACAVGASTYLAAPDEELDASAFDARRVGIERVRYTPRPYTQRGTDGFVAGLSSIDLLFNRGPYAREILRAGVV